MDNRQELYKRVKKRAKWYFEQDYNCAQAVALSNIEAFGGRTEGIIQLAAGFGKGMNAGCSCGAFAGGIMALGRLLSGPDSRGFDRQIEEAAAELHQRFVSEFGLTCCKGLRNKLSLLNKCKKITVTTATLTLELLLAKQAKATGA
ncbi:MAG: putative redox-active protein (C_GCAxxG_C_C) [Pelotomaculum sp. PtaB.Bin104]|nr:MAG: putative redox-active protein (C_GCAxxG_C_C) [Pelotomaculum sp. PtaB.Bin104]